TEDTTSLSALLSDDQPKIDEAKAAWNEYRAKVDAQAEALDALNSFASLLVQQIRVAAKKSGTNELYQLALIDPPKPATPRSEAPIPTNLATDTTTSGQIVLTFKGSKAGGVVFEVQRQLVSIGELPGAWEPLGTIGNKEFVDENVPSGLAQINYRVRSVLTTGIVSQWSFPAPFYFGSGNQTTQTQSVTQEARGGSDEGDGLTIEDAQALKDAQSAHGSAQAG
ncbi:MAG: hypothetical protein ACFCBV_11020, partial [Phycisphaerales bacterium]